jgi:NADH:ubiquinone oxidoreductase subunit 4 (subunit M)
MIENTGILLSIIMAIPMLGVMFSSLAKDGQGQTIKGRNVLSVGIFTVLSNLVILWITARKINVNGTNLQLIEKFKWLETPNIELVFGIDFFSLLLIAAIHFAVLLGMIGVRNNPYRQKTLIILSLLFLSMITGYLLAADIF